jgi:hypothetical protein
MRKKNKDRPMELLFTRQPYGVVCKQRNMATYLLLYFGNLESFIKISVTSLPKTLYIRCFAGLKRYTWQNYSCS